jgi:hypothetical protein
VDDDGVRTFGELQEDAAYRRRLLLGGCPGPFSKAAICCVEQAEQYGDYFGAGGFYGGSGLSLLGVAAEVELYGPESEGLTAARGNAGVVPEADSAQQTNSEEQPTDEARPFH